MSAGRPSRAGPAHPAVCGITCMSPIAPSTETMDWLWPLSHRESARTRSPMPLSCAIRSTGTPVRCAMDQSVSPACTWYAAACCAPARMAAVATRAAAPTIRVTMPGQLAIGVRGASNPERSSGGPGRQASLVSCQGLDLDTLASRQRQVELFERYAALLTEQQRDVLELYLRSDWSLSEIARSRDTSPAAVYDLIRRAALALEDYEERLGLLAADRPRREARPALARDPADIRRRLGRVEPG